MAADVVKVVDQGMEIADEGFDYESEKEGIPE